MSRRPNAAPAFLLAGALLTTAGCAAARAPSAEIPGTPAGHPGARLLYAVRVEGPEGRRSGIRLAAAIAPPARLRFEALGPAGGTRLVLATDGTRAVALLVPERRFDTAAATAEALAAWTGLPLGPAALVALLAGRAPCPPADADHRADAGADRCPDTWFRPAGAAPAAPACSGTLHGRDGDRVLATIECAGGEARGDAGGWPVRIRVDLRAGGRSIELRRIDGPAAAFLQDTLFAPGIPAGFERADLLGPAAAGPLLDGGPEMTP